MGDRRFFFPKIFSLKYCLKPLHVKTPFFYYLPVCKSHLHLENECMKWTLLYEEDTSAEKKKNPKIGKKSSSVKRNGMF